jgi:hypothetical protein
MRGGRRPRRFVVGSARASCPSGRWGPRRCRVTECWATIRAEDVYTYLLRCRQAGTSGGMRWSLPTGDVWVSWEHRPNAVWPDGRLFVTCHECGRRATRLYVPTPGAQPACRRCWGLTYESRQHSNYKDTGRLFRRLGVTSRIFSRFITEGSRERGAAAAAVRQAERRRIRAEQSTSRSE